MENHGDLFNSIIKKKERRSNFDLSHDVKLSLDMGKLVPITVIDTIPGDKITISTSSMLRLAPLVSPVMHKIDVFIEYFFVPNRILWGNWESFITGSKNGKQLATEDLPAFPIVAPYETSYMDVGNGSLSDYFGIPTPSDFNAENQPNVLLTVSAIPYAAYQRIWDEYYRDQNLMMSMYDVLDGDLVNYNQLPDGTQPIAVGQQLGEIRPRSWEHDYFTSALPWAQKGEQVSIPVDTSGLSIGGEITFNNSGTAHTKMLMTTGENFIGGDPVIAFSNSNDSSPGFNNASAVRRQVRIDNTDNFNYSTLTVEGGGSGTGLSINDLRAAIKLQEWLETNARGGSRYFESIYAHFGVKSPDSRLQRPEFIGSQRSNMIISEVLQTSSPQSETDTPQGNMSGHGQSVGTSRNFTYYAQEHGYIIGLLSVMPKTAYQQGIPKHFLKFSDKLDYYFPEFAHLGEQEIKNIEIFAGGLSTELYETFGYTPRYAEYKFMNSRVAGDFRDTLKFWHMGRIFEDRPQLNDAFIASDPTKRIFAVQDLPQDGETPTTEGIRDYHSIYAHVYHNVTANRLMPKYGTPTTGGI